MTQQKIGIAMSGGVDSSVSASILKQKGFNVHGFFMLLPLPNVEHHLERVQKVAEHLNIPLHCIDMRESFKRTVIDYFIRTYTNGRTPNPCIVCNKTIKFGRLLDEARNKGMDKMATGHYARITKGENGQHMVQRGKDPKKDQSYFLCRLSSGQLKYIHFPLGELSKKEVYGLAAELKISGVHGPESQDVCFLSGESVSSFMDRQNINDQPGDILTPEGTVIGRHQGLWHYTVGQRRGLGLPDATPWYVKQLDTGKNELILCKNAELFTRKIIVSEVLWNDSVPLPWHGQVQIRGRHHASPATVVQGEDNTETIIFETSQRAVTPGQFAVFYQDDVVIGSGLITGQVA